MNQEKQELLQALIDEIKGLREDVKRLQTNQNVLHYHYQQPYTYVYQQPYTVTWTSNTGGVLQC